MLIRLAELTDLTWLTAHDRHIAWEECERSVRLRRVLVAEAENGELVGWLRWNLFWDNTPFMNMLYLLPERRRQGYGGALLFPGEAAELILMKDLTAHGAHER